MAEENGLGCPPTAEPSPVTPAKAKAAWRNHLLQLAAGLSPSLRIGLAATFTAEALAPFLGAHLLAQRLSPAIKIGPYNQLFQVCVDPQAHFGADCDLICLVWRMEDLMLEEITAFLRGESSALPDCLTKVGLIGQAVSSLRSAFAGSIVVNVPPLPVSLPAHALDLGHPTGLGALHRAIATAFIERMASIEGVRLWDLDALQRQVGIAGSFDARQWYLYRQPFTDRFLFETGALLSRVIAAQRQPPRKCIVLDCDNTLWGGVVGEDGVGGLQIGDEFPGSAYRDFQRLLLHWRSQGILLALASKNNEADVWEVFAQHSGMALKRDHFSAWQINWNPKADNIVLIARTLNIGIDSLVFIDDSAMEIEYMRRAQPEVFSVQLPDDPADILPTLRALPQLDRLDLTAEDRARAEMMRAENQRQEQAGQMSKEQFQQSLDLRIRFFSADSGSLDRIAQLINKTNQFNLTTVRRSLDELRVLARSATSRIFGVRVTDRFGEYGLTGVVIAERAPARAAWIIDTFLLSCRVLGRGVETALLAKVGEEAAIDGARELFARFIPSAKNALAASFLPDHGFTRGEGDTWRIPLSAIPPAPESVTFVEAD